MRTTVYPAGTAGAAAGDQPGRQNTRVRNVRHESGLARRPLRGEPSTAAGAIWTGSPSSWSPTRKSASAILWSCCFIGPLHDAVLTLEAARENGDIVTSRKAARWVTVEVTGKAAHAGVEPEKGRSATAALGHILVETYKLNGMKPGMTVNFGDISCGRARISSPTGRWGISICEPGPMPISCNSQRPSSA